LFGKVEIECSLGDEDALGPVFEVESGERADTGKGDVGLARFTGSTHVDEG
jgi:hypothetical protein